LAIAELRERHAVSGGLAAWIVLAISFAADGVSWLQSMRQARGQAKEYGIPVWRYIRLSSDPAVRAIVVEDSAALIGLCLAASGLLLSKILGTNVPDSLASLFIGLLLGIKAFGLARPLGFRRLLACDPFVTREQVTDLGVELVDMDTVFRESDFVSVNTYLNDSTRDLVGERHFRLMKPTAYFINTARGGIVQHDALAKALKEKWIAGAGIDVFPNEPPPKDDPLFTLDNVIVAPHALAWTHAIMHDNGVETCGHVLKVARGEVPDAVVNREVLDRPGFRKKLEHYRQRATAARRG